MEKDIDVFLGFLDQLSEEDKIRTSPLHLAFLGDAVYELFVRSLLFNKDMSVHKLHNLSVKYVRAKSQSDILEILDEHLTDKEKSVVRRGRNAKSNTVAKNASIGEYRRATGFESLLGYLYINRELDRIREIFTLIEKWGD